MKKILITGSFEGAVNLTYGESGVGVETFPPLLHVDLSGAVLEDRQKVWLLRTIPPRYGPIDVGGGELIGFEQVFTTKLKVIVEDAEVDFERDFWTPYGKKLNRERCLKVWLKMSKTDRILAVVRLSAYLRYLGRTAVGKADPENYLAKKYYRNDYDNL
jgi:hypothetical protein